MPPLLESLAELGQHEGNFTKFGEVDDDDINDFLRPNILASVGPYAAGDVTGDGLIDSLIFDRFKYEYYEGSVALNLSIPEPSAFTIAVLGCRFQVSRRWSRAATGRSRQRLSRADGQ